MGLWLGKCTQSSEVFIGTSKGVVRARSIRRLPPDQKYNLKIFKEFDATPWEPKKDGKFYPEFILPEDGSQPNLNRENIKKEKTTSQDLLQPGRPKVKLSRPHSTDDSMADEEGKEPQSKISRETVVEMDQGDFEDPPIIPKQTASSSTAETRKQSLPVEAEQSQSKTSTSISGSATIWKIY